MSALLKSIALCFTVICIGIQCYASSNNSTARQSTEPDSLITSDSYLDSIMSKQLDEVQVTANLNRREGNKDIITITKAMREGTHNSGELLGKVAGVIYNPLTTELSYLGSKNIVVLVDGVQKDEGYIKRLNPDRFSKIEITNMPTGLYAGYDAVIELYTKQLYTGYEGVLLTQDFFSPGERYGKGKFLNNSRNAGQYTYTREKFNFDFVIGYTFDQQGIDDYFTTEYPLNGIVEKTVETPFKSPNKVTHEIKYYADMSVDYEINKNHSVSARVKITPSSMHEDLNYTLQRTHTNPGATNTIMETQRNYDRNRLDILAGLWYRGRISRWYLNANAAYTHIGYDRDRQIDRTTGYHLTDDREIRSQYFSGGIQASRYLFDNKWLLSLSDNVILTQYKEQRAKSELLLSKSDDFRNTFNASIQFIGSNKINASMNAGMTVFRNSYGNMSDTYVTPRFGAMLMWTPSDKANLRFNYTVSTSYPSLSALQDYGQFTDSLMYTAGNPNLKTSLNHDISFFATFFNSLTLSGSLVHRNNAVFNYYTPQEGEIPSGETNYYTCLAPVNSRKTQWSLNLTYSKQFGKNWQISLTGTVKGNAAKYGNEKISKVLPEYDWYVMYQLMKGTMRIYLSGSMTHYNYFTPQSDIWFLDEGNALSIEKYFLGDKLSVTAMWYIPLYFSNGKYHGSIDSPSYKKHYWSNNQKRKNNMVSIAVLFRFNGGKSVKNYNRDSESVEL